MGRGTYGLPDENGGIILKLDSNSPLKSRITGKRCHKNDGRHRNKKAEDLLNIYQLSKWKGQIKIEAIRNQQPIQVILLLK